MANQFRLVVVTPETTLLDEMVESVRLPLYDGMAGILPGRAPMVGRLGYGTLTVINGPEERTWFLDGGFVQMAGGVCSILTNRAMPLDELDPADAERRLEAANVLVPNTPGGFDAKEREQERARRIIATAGRQV